MVVATPIITGYGHSPPLEYSSAALELFREGEGKLFNKFLIAIMFSKLLSLALFCFLSPTQTSGAQSTLTYYINNCLDLLQTQEAEDWIGYFVTRPPETIAPDSSINFVLSYASIPNDHVILGRNCPFPSLSPLRSLTDLDWGYWYGNGTYPLLHGYVQVLSGYSNLTVRHDVYTFKRQGVPDKTTGKVSPSFVFC